MAGDTIKIYPGSIMMIHGVSVFIYDFFQIGDLKKLIRGMDASERAICAIYASKTKNDETTIRALMDKETWMTGAEAIAKGFADELLEGTGPQIQLNKVNKILLVNGVKHYMDGLEIPERFHIPQIAAGPKNPDSNKNKITPAETEEGENKNMTLEELKAQHPDLVAQIEQEAVTADRNRIKEIEEIQDTIGDAEMIAEAKFTKPTNAANLALAAMKKQKATLGTNFLQNRANEMKPANNVPAKAYTATSRPFGITKDE